MAREGGNELVLIAEQVPWRLRPHTMNPFATDTKAKGTEMAPAVPWRPGPKRQGVSSQGPPDPGTGGELAGPP